MFSRLRIKTAEFRCGRSITQRPFKKGDVNTNGLVFLEYHIGCKDGQRWVTREQFERTTISTSTRTKKWAEENPAKRRKIASKSKKKWYSQATGLQKLRLNISTLIRQTFLLKGYRKTSRSQEILGCSYDFFKEWIEAQFTEQMGWDNRETWHLDHYIPCALARSKEELIALNRWSNIRPFASLNNLLKNDTVPFLPAPLELVWVYDRIPSTQKNGF